MNQIGCSERRLRIAMITSLRSRCGIADYSRTLVHALRHRVEIPVYCEPAAFDPAQNGLDAIHLQHQYFLYGGVAPWKNTFRRFADRLSAPTVMTVHEYVEPTGDPLRRLAIAWTNRTQFRNRHIDGLITHTNLDRERLIRLGVGAERIHVVPHFVPPAPALPSREEARSALGIGGSFVITIPGFLSRRKGHPAAIRAMAQMPSCARLFLAGGAHPDDRSQYADSLVQLAIQHGVAERVTVTGYLEDADMATIMAATDVILAPFTSGSGSGSLALAFACAKPIVASAIAPNIEIDSRTPGALYLVPPEDPNSIARAIDSLMQDGEALARLSARASEYAAQMTVVSVAQETADVLRRIAIVR